MDYFEQVRPASKTLPGVHFQRPGARVLRRPVLVATVVGVALLAGSGSVHAQSEDELLEQLRDEREQIQQEAADQAVKVDAATADFDEVAAALDELNALVDLQEARLADAEQAVRSAEAQIEQARQREDEIQLEVGDLVSVLGDLAVSSFTGEGGAQTGDLATLLVSSNPTEALRLRSLVEFQTGSLGDGLDRLRLLVAEAEVVSAQRLVAAQAAEAGRVEAEQRQIQLAEAQTAQLDLVLATESRLEARLAEAAFLAERDAEAAAQITRQEEIIAARIRQEAARRAAEAAAANPQNRPVVVTPAEIVSVRGIEVHESIAGKVEELLSAAAADGVDLSGWGYRDNLEQIALRQQNCGTSDFDIWERSPSSCSPPTARPGQSNHEKGLAIDFTHNGGSITTHSNPGFVWLANNASRWGFVNLASEPWHWSTTGD